MAGTIILLLATVFILAAVSKFRSRGAFKAVLRNLLPRTLVEPAAILVPVIELLLAGFLLSARAPQAALLAALGLLLFFTVILAEMGRRGLKGCACFGETDNSATNSSGVIRNLILIAATLFAVIQPGQISFLGPDFSSILARLTVVLGALCFWSCLVAVINQRKFLFPLIKL